MITLKDLSHLPPWEWPKETAGMLLKAINDTALDPSDRLPAVEMAGGPGGHQRFDSPCAACPCRRRR